MRTLDSLKRDPEYWVWKSKRIPDGTYSIKGMGEKPSPDFENSPEVVVTSWGIYIRDHFSEPNMFRNLITYSREEQPELYRELGEIRDRLVDLLRKNNHVTLRVALKFNLI